MEEHISLVQLGLTWPLGGLSARRISVGHQAGAAARRGACTPGPAAPAGLAPALLPRGWAKRQGLQTCLMCKAPKLRGQDEFPMLPQASPAGLHIEETTGVSVLALTSGPAAI